MKKYMHLYKLKDAPINALVITCIIINTFLVLLIATKMLSSTFSSIIISTAKKNTEQTTKNIARSIQSFITDKSQTMERVKEIYSSDGSEEQKKNDLNMILKFNSDIVSLCVYDEFGNIRIIACDQNLTVKEDYKINNLSFKKDKFDLSDGLYISEPHVNNIYEKYYPWVVTFELPYMNDDGTKNYIAMELKFSKISQYIDKISIGSRGYTYIADAYGHIVYHQQQQLIYSKLIKENLDVLDSVYESGTQVTDERIYSASDVDDTGWKIIGVSDIDELVTFKLRRYWGFGVCVIICGIIMSALIAYIMLRCLTNPLNQMISSIKEFEKNVDRYEGVKIQGFKEIRDLGTSFNHMAERIKYLMKKVVLDEKELRKLELKALHAQINPHFLYNTLDSIYWMCKEERNEEAAKMVYALADTFRISINRGRDEVTVRQELTHVQSYLVIQKIRYKNQFTYEFQIDDEILDCNCVKIILQPFVENAIYHGIDRFVEEGHIIIKGYRQEDKIIFKIIDNGIGMSEDEVNELLKEKSEKAGIGVKNVHDKIRIYYGDDYGVSIKSELDVGTEITVEIPYMKGDE